MLERTEIYKVTVIVATYNAVKNKALETLNSILLQKNVELQIIVADDCSKDNLFDDYKTFFEKKGFENYLLLDGKNNLGTVKNFCRCVEYCRGNYIKLISPGDYLYGETVLHDWAEYMDSKKLLLSISDAYYYQRQESGYKLVCEHAFPQAPMVLNSNNERKKKYYQLIYNDYWLGAATLIDIEVFKKYIEIVSDFAKYGEDNMYRIAACDGVSRGYYPRATIMYETNTGISSLGEKGNKWHKILMNEWVITNEFILLRLTENQKFKRQFEKLILWKKKNEDIREAKISKNNIVNLIIQLFPLFIYIPGMFIWSIRRVLFSRKTATSIDENKVNEIFNV